MKYLITGIAVFALLAGCKKGDNSTPANDSGGMAADQGSDKEHRRHDHAWNRDGGMHEHGKDRQVPGSN